MTDSVILIVRAILVMVLGAGSTVAADFRSAESPLAGDSAQAGPRRPEERIDQGSGRNGDALLSSPAKGGIYRLREGDALLISVWQEEGLQKEVRVLPDGSITFPLAGRVEVLGLSSPEVEKRVAEKLKEFIPEPTVTVVITGTDGSLVYVVGKVNKPGPIALRGPMTVLQALSLAGGPSTFADESGIKVVRTTAQGPDILSVDYDDLLKGKDMAANIQLQAGDTVQVP